MSRVFPDGTGETQTGGKALMSLYAAGFKRLFDASQLPLTNVDGTANDVTATVAPELDGDGLVDGMYFSITWAAANTGGMTLAINGGTPLPILDAAGVALSAGAVAAGVRSTLGYIGGEFRILSPLGGGGSGGPGGFSNMEVFETSGTFVVPEGVDLAYVYVLGPGGGGGGTGNSSGNPGAGGSGQAGGLAHGFVDLSSETSVAATIGAPGSGSFGNGSSGGTSSFLGLSAEGGQGGNSGGNGIVGLSGATGGSATAPGGVAVRGAPGGSGSTSPTSGAGGSSLFGPGARGTSNSVGNDALGPGGGGSGASSSSSSSRTGGDGGPGLVIVYY